MAVHRSSRYTFTKAAQPAIELVAGLGVEGDVHSGATVKHRSRLAIDPAQPNLRQVHLIHSELLLQLEVEPGQLGENITTQGVDLLGLSVGTRLRLGESAIVEVTGLRNPCLQIDRFREGLRSKVLDRDTDGNVVRRAGVMGIVITGGSVRPTATILIEFSPLEHRPLGPV